MTPQKTPGQKYYEQLDRSEDGGAAALLGLSAPKARTWEELEPWEKQANEEIAIRERMQGADLSTEGLTEAEKTFRRLLAGSQEGSTDAPR